MKNVSNFPTVLHRLLAEMEALSPEQIAAAEPKGHPLARSEKEIGEPLSDPLRALYALHHAKIERHNELAEQHQAMHAAVTEDAPIDLVGHVKILDETKILDDEIRALNRLFWRSVHENYEMDPQSNGVGLRAGWVVVDMYGAKPGGLIEMIFGRGGLGSLFD